MTFIVSSIAERRVFHHVLGFGRGNRYAWYKGLASVCRTHTHNILTQSSFLLQSNRNNRENKPKTGLRCGLQITNSICYARSDRPIEIGQHKPRNENGKGKNNGANEIVFIVFIWCERVTIRSNIISRQSNLCESRICFWLNEDKLLDYYENRNMRSIIHFAFCTVCSPAGFATVLGWKWRKKQNTVNNLLRSNDSPRTLQVRKMYLRRLGNIRWVIFA